MQSREPACQVTMLNVEPEIGRNVQPDQEAETLSMEPELECVTTSMEPDDGAKSLSMEPECKAETSGIEPERKVATVLEPDFKLENVIREEEEESGIKEEEKIEDNCLLTKDASIDRELSDDDSLAEATEASEPR